jgi:large subunit ribosomal protein L9
MKLILQETVLGLGKLGDIVTVKPGYARNFLIPNGKALLATEAHVEALNKIRAALEAKEAERVAAAKKRAEVFRDKAVVITMHASEEGKLYGSLAAADIVTAFEQIGHELEKSEVLMPGSVREVGDHPILLKFHPEVEVQVTVTVVASDESNFVEPKEELE